MEILALLLAMHIDMQVYESIVVYQKKVYESIVDFNRETTKFF